MKKRNNGLIGDLSKMCQSMLAHLFNVKRDVSKTVKEKAEETLSDLNVAKKKDVAAVKKMVKKTQKELDELKKTKTAKKPVKKVTKKTAEKKAAPQTKKPVAKKTATTTKAKKVVAKTVIKKAAPKKKTTKK